MSSKLDLFSHRKLYIDDAAWLVYLVSVVEKPIYNKHLVGKTKDRA